MDARGEAPHERSRMKVRKKGGVSRPWGVAENALAAGGPETNIAWTDIADMGRFTVRPMCDPARFLARCRARKGPLTH